MPMVPISVYNFSLAILQMDNAFCRDAQDILSRMGIILAQKTNMSVKL